MKCTQAYRNTLYMTWKQVAEQTEVISNKLHNIMEEEEGQEDKETDRE